MLLISIDTSGRNGSVALCRGDGNSFETLQLTSLEGGTYSARLMPSISELLQQNSFDKTALDGFVVVSGPGSFTGLRVGLATVKGLCEILQKPLATLSMLEALAVTYGAAGASVTAVLDAGRGEVYAGHYRVSSGHAMAECEWIANLEEFAAENPEGDTLTPDAKVADVLRVAGSNVRVVEPLRADRLGRIGLGKLLRGEVAEPATVDVNYIRRSDAEIFSAPKY
jgi:tRNA threonylcarbamoyladenosine biosynthesis protein TsaB